MLKTRWQVLILILCFSLIVAQVVAQEATPAPEETPSLIVPEETAPVPTDIPTDLPPEITPELTVEPPPVEVTAEPTVEPPLPPPATPEVLGLPPEPVLALLVREMFDTNDLSGWVYGLNWTPIANDGGFGLQVANAADVLQLQRGPFTNAAAQVSLNFTGGSVHLSLRQSEVGSYSAALDAAGLVTLYRAGVPVLSAPVVLPPAQWQMLRLSVMDGVLRAAVNDVELLTWQDIAPLPPGLAAVTVYPPADSAPFTVQVDNLFVWVPETDVALYPPPTPTAPPVEPTTPPIVTAEPTLPPIITAEPTVEVTPEIVVEVTAEATVEPTAVVTAEPTPAIDPLTGKSLVFQAYTPPVGSQPSVFNDPTDPRIIVNLPFIESDTTAGSNVDGEASFVLTCGFNITATVWYKFTPAATKQYIINTAGSTFDTILVVYPNNGGAPANNPVAGGCNDDASTTDRTSRLALTLTAGQPYWIRLGGYNGEAGVYNFSLIDPSLPKPAAPKLVSPATNTSTANFNPTFEWLAPTSGAVPAFYQLQISTASTFTTLLHTSPLILAPTTTYNGYTFLTDGVYYWRARALNANQVGGAWTAAFKLTTDSIEPAIPALTAPLNTITLTANRPVLSWKAAVGANRYRVSLTEEGGGPLLLLPGKDVVTGTSLSLTATVMAQPLQHGKTYAWNVVALDAANNESNPTANWTFSLNLMNAPADGLAVVAPVAARPTFTWYPAGFVGVKYVLEVDDDVNFTLPLLYQSPELTTTSHALPAANALPTGVTYYWRLRVLNHALPIPAAVPVRSFVVTPTASPTVTLLTPTNAKIVKDDPVVFTWRAVAATAPNPPYTYQIQVGTNRTFATDIVGDQTTAAGVTTEDFALLPGVYYWRVRALNNVGAPGAWSAVWSLTVDRSNTPAPTLKTPLDGSETNLVRPTLSWNKVTDAVRYRVQLQLEGTTNQLLVPAKAETTATSLALTSTAVLAQPLQHGSTYEWYVVALDVAGNESPDSDVWTFTVNLMKAPANAASLRVTLPARPAFSWASAGLPAAPAATYTLTVGKDSAFGVSKTYPVTTALSLTPPVGEAFFNTAGTYYWKLQVNGQPANPPVWSFVLSTTLPGTPTLLNPPTGKAFNTDPTLSWKAPTGGPFSYEIQLANNSTFTLSAIVFNVGSPLEFTPVNLVDGLTYWWRVRAVNADGAAGPWSAYRTFIYDTTAPTNVPVLLTPADGAVFTGPLPRFTWRAVTGFTRYEIQIITTGNFTNPPPLGFAITTTGFTPYGPLLYTDYRWRVRVLDAAGNGGPWSEPFDLKVVSATTAVPVLNRFTDNTPTLTWTPISWAAAYEVQISYNSTFTNLLPAIVPITPPTTSYTTAPLANGTYYWRVRAQRADTTWGAWSTGGTGSFQVDAP